jgi:hypothetical protein
LGESSGSALTYIVRKAAKPRADPAGTANQILARRL